MTNTEEFLDKKFGRQNHFTVPEGYFSQLQKNVMDSLPEQQPKVVKMTPRHRYLLPVMTAAASVCIAVCGISIWFNKTAENTEANVALSESTSSYSDSEAEDYIMMDNEAIYAYMSRN